MFNKIFKTRTNCASTSTTAQITDTAAVLNTPVAQENASDISFFDAGCIFDTNTEYAKKVQKLFLTIMGRIISESTYTTEFNKVRNANSYAAVAGKPLDTRKFIGSNYYPYQNVFKLDFWQKFVSDDWKQLPYFRGFEVKAVNPSHQSGDTDIIDCYISIGDSFIEISNRCGWSEKFIQKLILVAGLLIVTKIGGENRSEEFKAYGVNHSYRFPFTCHEYDHFYKMEQNSSTAMTISAHKYILHNKPDISIVTREKNRSYWQRPRALSVYCCEEAEKYNHQYFMVELTQNTSSLKTFHNR